MDWLLEDCQLFCELCGYAVILNVVGDEILIRSPAANSDSPGGEVEIGHVPPAQVLIEGLSTRTEYSYGGQGGGGKITQSNTFGTAR